MCKILKKDSNFNFDELCIKDFEYLKEFLISAPIIMALD